MVDPKFVGGAAEMMIAGNDAAAKKKVVGILKEFGWPGAIDVGGIEGARWIEALRPLWGLAGSVTNPWGHGFKVVHGGALTLKQVDFSRLPTPGARPWFPICELARVSRIARPDLAE